MGKRKILGTEKLDAALSDLPPDKREAMRSEILAALQDPDFLAKSKPVRGLAENESACIDCGGPLRRISEMGDGDALYDCGRCDESFIGKDIS